MAGVLCCSCANLIGLNDLGGDGAGGSTSDSGSGGDGDTGGGTADTGGEPGGGGAETGGTNTGGADTGGTGTGGTGTGGASTGGASGGSASGGGGSGVGGGGQLYICTDDQFEYPEVTEGCWDVFNAGLLQFGDDDRGYAMGTSMEAGMQNGYVSFLPEVGPAWKNGEAAYLMYQEVEGNFLFEVQLQVLEPSGSFNPPARGDAFGGILAIPVTAPLSEEAGAEHGGYYAIKAGILANPSQPGYRAEYTTEAGVTTSEEREHEDAWEGGYLRMCRVDNRLWTGVKFHKDDYWLPLHGNDVSAGYETENEDLPDLGEILRVGLIGEVSGTDGEDGAVVRYFDSEFRVPLDIFECNE